MQPTPQYPHVVVVVRSVGRRSSSPGSDSAPVGQEETQPPHATQSDSSHEPPLPGATTVAYPREAIVSANVPCTSSHIRTQRAHAMHRSRSSFTYGWLKSKPRPS